MVSNLVLFMLSSQSKEEDIGRHPSLNTNFYCFHLPADAAKMFDRKALKEVGIHSPWDVGAQLVDIFEKKNKQNELAEELRSYIKNRRQNVDL